MRGLDVLGSRLWISLLLVGLAAACGDDVGPQGAPCSVCLKDGLYAGKTDGDGEVTFRIGDGRFTDSLGLYDDGCGGLPFQLDNVYVDGDRIRTQQSDRTVLTLQGSITSSTTAKGSYELKISFGGTSSCKAAGSWSVSWQKQ